VRIAGGRGVPDHPLGVMSQQVVHGEKLRFVGFAKHHRLRSPPVNIHKNARTTPNMRALIVGRRQAGETPRSIAGAVGVSPATVRKWLRRHESEGAAGLQDRTSRPHRLRTRITSDRPGRSPAPGPSAVLEDRPRGRAFPWPGGPHRKGQGAEPPVRPRSNDQDHPPVGSARSRSSEVLVMTNASGSPPR